MMDLKEVSTEELLKELKKGKKFNLINVVFIKST